MQTFLPDPDFAGSARLLDSRRLGKQRVEALQVLRALTRVPYGWKSHPAVLMWAGCEEALVAYALAMCEEWGRRGHPDTVAGTIVEDFKAATGVDQVRSQAELAAAGALPTWLFDEALHRSHRSALVRKDPSFYRPYFPDVPDDLPYVWPVRSQRALRAEVARQDPSPAEEWTEGGVGVMPDT
ncbi:MAG: MSMEG_6728 family protein [Actinobacteria bacterium]|nr:MSMEG_6728 family protein [Actinomycetota bacterium]